ncbi:MAG: restriction endonuclease subunit S [Gemmiger sp.]
MQWKTEALSEIAFMTSGGTPSKKHPEYYKDGTIPWVRSGELENGAIRDTEIKITQAGLDASSAKIFPKGTLLIALYGATIGKLAYLDIEACTNQAVCGIFENEKVSQKYLYYFLLFHRPNLIKQGIGGAQPNISQTILKKMMVSYPCDKAEQLRIVGKIEELSSRLDASVAELQTAKEKLKVYRQAVYSSVYDGMRDLQPITSFFEITGGLTKNSRRNELPLQMPYLRVANVYYNQLDLSEIKEIGVTEQEIDRCLLEKNDLLFVEGNGSKSQIGRVAIWNGQIPKCLHQNHIVKGRPLGNMLSEYALYYLISNEGRKQIVNIAKSTSGLYTLSTNKIKGLKVPYCDLNAQKKILDNLKEKLSVYDSIEQTIDASLQQAEALRQSILKQAFEGEL